MKEERMAGNYETEAKGAVKSDAAGPLADEIRRYDDLLDNLGHQVDRLEIKAQLLLRPDDRPPTSKESDPTPSRSAHRDRLDQTNGRLIHITAVLEGLIDRLEV
jgi:hypothetical protein